MTSRMHHFTSPSLTRRTLLGGAGLAAAGGLAAAQLPAGSPFPGLCVAQAAPDGIVETNLGVGMTGLNFNNGQLVGREFWLCSALMEPVRLAAYDLDEGRITKSVELPGVLGIWGIDHIGSEIYVGTFTTGKIFRIDAETATILDEVDVGQEVVWNVKASPDGKIFGGTYPEAQLWEYDPETGEATNHGRMSDETYVRDLVATETTVYCGIGAAPGLVAYDRATGETTDIMPPEFADLSFVAVLELSGNWLLAGTTPLARVAMINTQDHSDYTIVEIPNDEPFVVGLYGDGDDVYVATTQSNTIWHGTIGSEEVTPVVTTEAAARRLGRVDEDTLWITQKHTGALIDLTSGEVTEFDILGSEYLDASAQQPMSLHWADGRVFLSGTGYMAVHAEDGSADPVYVKTSGEVKELQAADGRLYTAHYTLAIFGSMPTDGDEITLHGQVPRSENQTRPLDIDLDLTEGRVLMGTEPEYGGWEGALAWMDMTSHEIETFHGVLEDQSVSAVCPAPGGIFIGGTVVNGYGTTPTRETAQLGFFSYRTGELERLVEDLPATREVIDLRYAEGILLALGIEGTMVGIDADSLEVLWSVEVSSRGGRTGRIGDTIYGSDFDQLWALTLSGRDEPSVEVLVEGLESEIWGKPAVTTDGESALFTMRGYDLVRFDLPTDGDPSPTPEPSPDPSEEPSEDPGDDRPGLPDTGA